MTYERDEQLWAGPIRGAGHAQAVKHYTELAEQAAKLRAADDKFGAALDNLSALLSEEAEAERQRKFQANMDELAACRAELRRILS